LVVFPNGKVDTVTQRKSVAFVLSNKAVSSVTGWPIGFWLAELTHAYEEFVEAGFAITLFSPDGGALYMDDFSDPYAENGYSADDEISKRFLENPETKALLDSTTPLSDLDASVFDTVFLVGGQGPMETFRHNPAVEGVVRDFYEAGKPTAIVCHATAVLLDATDSNGDLIVAGKEWTGFTKAEEEYVEQNVGRKFQPFWIENEANKIDNTTFVAAEPMSAHAIRSGNLITGQQQNSGAAAAKLVIEDVG
jgi:putative intracellular protease/amidase